MTDRDWQVSLWLYPWDAADEGVEAVVETAATRAGANAFNLAVSYHSGMFLLPHNPRRKLYFPTPAIYFQPDATRYHGLRIQPRVHELADQQVVAAVRRATSARGMALNAWTVCLHNSDIGTRYPDVTNVNAFGDHHRPHLCPANPDVRAYICALVGDLAQRDFDAILVESLDYQLYTHGFHHEVTGVPLTPYVGYLLGLCFCDHCLAAAREAGVDGAAVRRFARAELEAYFGGEDAVGRPAITWPEIRALAGGELGAYQDMRIRVVAGLYQEVRATWPRGSGPDLEIIDFGPFRPLGWDGCAEASGLDLRAVGAEVNGAHPCLYFTAASQVAEQAELYRQKAPDHWAISAAIRAIPPQVIDEAGLTAQVRASGPSWVAGYSFYNYGFMRLPTLDWIRHALEAARGAEVTP